MCYQIVELYSGCRCVYYQHAVDRCAAYGRGTHGVQQRTILVGYGCGAHNTPEVVKASASRYQYNDFGYQWFGTAVNADDGGFDDDIDDDDGGSSVHVFSVVSGQSTVLTLPTDETQDLTAALFRDLLNEPSLRHLWPQVLQCSVAGPVYIARFLKRFSEDLSKQADTPIQKRAANLIRKSRLSIARRITECHSKVSKGAWEEGEEALEDEAILDSWFEQPAEEVREKEETLVPYDELYRFLFSREEGDASPLESLVFGVKLFVARAEVDPDVKGNLWTATPMRSLRIAQARLASRFSRSKIPKPSPGAVRLEWTCSCGQMLSDDYIEKTEGGLADLKDILDNYSLSTSSLAKSMSPGPLATSEVPVPDNVWHVSNLIKAFTQRHPNNKNNLPNDEGKAELGDICRSSEGTNASSPGNNHRFLVACAPYMRFATFAHQPDVCRIHSDRHFFRLLRSLYVESRRGRSRWRSWLTRVTSIRFVKLEVFSSSIADIKACPSMPDMNARAGYDFEPSDTEPPVGPNLLQHLYENPECAEVLPVLFGRVPKKMRDRLTACPDRGVSSAGWGIQMVEGPDDFVVFVLGVIGFAISLVISVVYTCVKEDIQGGFAVGAFMLAFFLYCGKSLPGSTAGL